VLIEHFSSAVTIEALRADIGKNRCVRKDMGWANLSANFKGNGASSSNGCLCLLDLSAAFDTIDNGVPGLSGGVVCVIIAVLTQYRRVSDRHTYRHDTRAS